MRPAAPILLRYGLWTVIIVIALVLEIIPVLLVVAMVGLAVGVPKGPGLLILPIAVAGMVFAACIAATTLTKRVVAGSGAGEYYRDPKRLG